LRADQDVIADRHGMAAGAADHGVLHDDAARTELDWPAFRRQDRAEADTGLRAAGYIAADHCRRRDAGRGVNAWALALVFDEHGAGPLEAAIAVSVRKMLRPKATPRRGIALYQISILNTHLMGRSGPPDVVAALARCPTSSRAPRRAGEPLRPMRWVFNIETWY
jgi:hypothetical protein